MSNATSNNNLVRIVKSLVPGTLLTIGIAGIAIGAGLYNMGQKEVTLSINPAAYQIKFSHEDSSNGVPTIISTVYSFKAGLFDEGHLCKREFEQPINPEGNWSSSSDYLCIFGF